MQSSLRMMNQPRLYLKTQAGLVVAGCIVRQITSCLVAVALIGSRKQWGRTKNRAVEANAGRTRGLIRVAG